MRNNEKYTKALRIEDADLFQHGMNTNVGNAFVYGTLKAIDTVTYPEIDGEYMYVRKVKEKYTRHTRIVTKTKTVNGKTVTYTETEVYWTWDFAGQEEKTCENIKFCSIQFPVNKINLPSSDYIDTVNESKHVRFVYYGIPAEMTGTIFTDLRDKTISDGSYFYENMDITETTEYVISKGGSILFWIFWLPLTIGLVIVFYIADNKWLH